MPDGVREQIAKNIQYYRKKRKLTQKELARQLGVNNSAVSNWETGANSIDIDTLFRVCKILGVTANDMYGIKPEEPQTIAAHFDGDEYTEDELDEIRKYAEFVKSKRKE